ncbi:MAG TPA: hypothetical protein VGH89_35835 [Pseudonocardia sp.]
MFTIFVIAGLSVLAGTALWRVFDPEPSSATNPTRPTWSCFGAYTTTSGGQTLIIAGGGPGAIAVAITEPTPPPPTPTPLPAVPVVPVVAPQPHTPTAPPMPVTGPRPDHQHDADRGQPAELAELEQLWRLPTRQPTTATLAAEPPPAPETPSSLGTPA